MIRTLIRALVVAALSPIMASGQDVPRFEVFTGYSYLRGRGATIPTRVDENSDMHGWNISVVRNLNDWFALVGDFSGHYGGTESHVATSDGPFTSEFSKHIHLFLVGPRVSLWKKGRFTPFAHSLIGVTRASSKTEDKLSSLPPFKVSNTDVGLAAAFGLGLDINLTRAVAVRVVQADYLVTRIDASDLQRQNKENLRVSTGISFRFGK